MEPIVDSSPQWLKSSYITLMQSVKGMLARIGLLEKLDKRAKTNLYFHYVRSLFAIYQLDDMIALDVPWWTYSAIDVINKHIEGLTYKPHIFEYGSGASTLWLAKRSEKLISIEHDKIWFEKLKNKLIDYPHVELLFCQGKIAKDEKKYRSAKMPKYSFESYVKTIQDFQQSFDIIIIDGRSREACLEACLPFLKPQGLIVFDNSDRKRYQAALHHPLLEIERYRGWVPGSPFFSETALLRKKT